MPREFAAALSRALTHATRRMLALFRPGAYDRLSGASLDDLPDAVLATDAQGRVRRANPAAARRFGFARPVDMVALCASELLAWHMPSLLRELPSLAHAQGVHARQLRAFVLETADGSREGDLLVKGVPRTRPDGTLRGWVLTLVDIGSVREAQRRRDEALRFISHDIRAPQASILSLIEMRRRRGASDPSDATLARIEDLARQSIALADGFLRLARAESGFYIFERANLGDLLLEAVDQFWAQARVGGIELITEVPPEGAYCPVERSLLQRALANLVDNAIKFSPPGGTVRCMLRRDGAWWRVDVLDQGRGMAAHELPLLFQRFRRLAAKGSGEPDGTGLGLAFVKAVVTQHRGHIEVFSAPGLGSEFRVRLPTLDGDALMLPPDDPKF